MKIRVRRSLVACIASSILVGVAFGVYRGFFDVMPSVPPNSISEFVDDGAIADGTWRRSPMSYCDSGEGGCGSWMERCFESHCSQSWELVERADDPSRKRVAAVELSVARDAHRFEGWWRMRWWEPSVSSAYNYTSRDVSIEDSVAPSADEVVVWCSYNQYGPPDDEGCIWTVMLRYGQYVFSLVYLNEDQYGGISEREFVDEYVAPYADFASSMIGV